MAEIHNHTDFAFIVTVTFPVLLIGIAYPALVYSSIGNKIAWDINWVAELLPQTIVILCSFAAFIHYPKYRKSSLCNGVEGVAHFVFIVLLIQRKSTRTYAILDLIMTCSKLWSPVLIVNEYFMQNENLWTLKQRQTELQTGWKGTWGEHYLVEDPTLSENEYQQGAEIGEEKLRVNVEPPETDPDLPHQETTPLHPRFGQNEQRERTLALFYSLENLCYFMIVLCMTGSTFFAEFLPFMDFSANSFWVALLILQILKIQKAVSYGAILFTSEHSNGLVAALLIGGMASQLLLNVTIGKSLSGSLFYGPSAETFTRAIPLFFHYYNIFCSHRKACNTGQRMKWALILLVVQFNVLIMGVAIYGYEMPPLVTCARVAGWAAALNFGYVALAIISPILQLVLQLLNFNIMYHAFHAINFHRSAATSGLLFSILHVALLLTHEFTECCEVAINITNSNYVSNYKCFDICALQTRLSGIVILLGVEGAWITGYFGRFTRSSLLSSLHFPCTCLAFFGLFSHASTSPDYPFGTYFVLASFLICLLVYSLFFFFNPVQSLEVDTQDTLWLQKNNCFSFLVVNYNNCSTIPPGSFFLIYSPQKSNLAHFHAHPFPVFSSRNRRLAFLMHCRISNPASFTQRLSLEKPLSLNLQGPFQGAASSFINYLSSIHSPTDVYLCGWEAGLASIFSILEFLKDSVHSYEIRSICCLFNAIYEFETTQKTHSYINNLVREWQNPTTVTIIESEDRDLEYIQLMADRPALENKEIAMNFWRNRFPNRTRWLVMRDTQNFLDVHQPSDSSSSIRRDMYGQKVLYFCGSGFESDKFHYGEWRPFVETIP